MRDNTALSGKHYAAIETLLSFKGNVDTPETENIVVNTFDDTEVDGDKIFTLALSNPSIGIILQPNPIRIVIVDDDSGNDRNRSRIVCIILYSHCKLFPMYIQEHSLD